jgi:hypothetical protein
MYLAIFDYIDRVFCVVRPRQLLYMAIDGVSRALRAPLPLKYLTFSRRPLTPSLSVPLPPRSPRAPR